jgi:hypothetical protein
MMDITLDNNNENGNGNGTGNTYSHTHAERCKDLVESVKNISQNEMEEIFKMIHNYGCMYTRNNNGLFINLTWIPEDLLDELEKYIKFCSRSQTELKKYESICDVLNTKLKETSSNLKKQQLIINTVSDPVLLLNENGLNVDSIDEFKDDHVHSTDNENFEDNIDENTCEIIEKTGVRISSSMKIFFT